MATRFDTPMSRRALLGAALAAAGWPLARLDARMRQAADIPWKTTPFSLGVASGDPTSTGIVLWTRLAWDPLHDGGIPAASLPVKWELAADERFTRPVRQGTAIAEPAWAHAIHVEVEGLEPDRWYWYRFRLGDDLSPIGRTRTLPRPGAAVNRLRFGFASCQHYEYGYFTALRHLSAEDLDVCFHLGDYIYEYGPDVSAVRPRLHVGPEITTLEDYRLRYALYKSDPDLQAAHAAFPWIVTPDDHEVDNNYADAIAEDNAAYYPFLQRRAAAYRAYYEHMPLRRSSIPDGPWVRLYRQFDYGSLASFFVLDTRQYRTNQPCGDGSKVPCPETVSANATLMGGMQRRWLYDGLAASASSWHVIPQQVMMARVDQFAGPEARYSMDQWTGYEAERQGFLQFLAGARPANPVVLTGDIHANYVNNLQLNPGNPASPVLATEFVGTSITSGGDGADAPARLPTLLSENPFVKFHNTQRGYVRCDVTPAGLRADYRVVDYVTRPGSPVKTRASFHVEAGKPGAETS